MPSPRPTDSWTTCVALALLVVASSARADVPITQRGTWSGAIDFFATGASIAVDGPDADTTQVDTLLSPASVEVRADDVPPDALLVQAFLYWSGSIGNSNCAGTTLDGDVDFAGPGASAPTTVTADVCHCSDAGVSGYDTQVCRADVSALVSDMVGLYTVDGFAASIANRSTDNASFSLVLVFSQVDLPPRRVALYDGIQTMHTPAGTAPLSIAVTLAGVKVDDPPEGDLTWYALEGDKGGSGTEGVTVSGQPGGLALALGDAVNPTTNPMNHTINTAHPPETGTLGVDIDRFAVDGALTPGDTSLLMTYSAGSDKFWIAYNIVGVNVFEAVFAAASSKTWQLSHDADGDQVPSAGDTLVYTIHLENSGRAPGAPRIHDELPADAVASWRLIATGGGVDQSSGLRLQVAGPLLAPGETSDIVYEIVLAELPDGTPIDNIATFDSTPAGDKGELIAATAFLRKDDDSDGAFDGADNCPAIDNPTQADADQDGLGDACDVCPDDADNDVDDDGVCADHDDCPLVKDADQADRDGDGRGDACDPCPDDASDDGDGDGACEDVDNCPGRDNATQADADQDGTGDACDPCPTDASDDEDQDGVCGGVDNCPGVANDSQADGDGDGLGDACDACADDAANDADGDLVCGDVDNCPAAANADQEDRDGDGIGDACDGCLDVDRDGACDDKDNCPALANPEQSDGDGDGQGDACDACPGNAEGDVDRDGVCGDLDNCPTVANADQADGDDDGIGDACDGGDGDGVGDGDGGGDGDDGGDGESAAPRTGDDGCGCAGATAGGAARSGARADGIIVVVGLAGLWTLARRRARRRV